jgi:3-phenylpropionate/trans-cinnamate dioxygenase ferredoxin reductase subunit
MSKGAPVAKDRTFVIVGASLAGAKAAEALREQGYDGRLVLIGAEAERPYERPPLTKGYLRGDDGPDKLYVHDEGFYADHEVELLLGRTAEGLDTRARTVTLDGGELLGYERLLLATGAEPRTLDIPGAGLDGVHYLRTKADSDALRAQLEQGGRGVVVVGSGWIGAEIAASARQMRNDVTMISPDQAPLARVLGPEVGAVFRDLHRANGVQLLLGTGVEALEGDGAVGRVRTADGSTVDCDVVVVGVGVRPRTELAEAGGLQVDNGVLVDGHLQASTPEVFAAGDVANELHPFYGQRIRVEHWANALNQPPVAAQGMLGKEAVFDTLPFFFSDQFDVGMEYAGYARDWDRVVFRGDVGGREFLAFWLKGGRVVAGMNLNVWDISETIQALIRSRAQVDETQLADPGVPLELLIGEGGASGH